MAEVVTESGYVIPDGYHEDPMDPGTYDPYGNLVYDLVPDREHDPDDSLKLTGGRTAPEDPTAWDFDNAYQMELHAFVGDMLGALIRAKDLDRTSGYTFAPDNVNSGGEPSRAHRH